MIMEEVDKMEDLLNQLLQGQNEIKNDIKEIKSEVTDIKNAVHRIELSQPQDIVAILDRMNKNLENKTDVLNKRVFNVETELERLNRQ
jgi:vacuolar-type H+-ATPase subunit D/Vma8